ncbi:MAG TPA: immunoglobulin domain-containing protein [Verrucomicrobiae bacterium]|nr:immunoglobulin domain-containing protein [Verrucomicrobiae bacterium]
MVELDYTGVFYNQAGASFNIYTDGSFTAPYTTSGQIFHNAGLVKKSLATGPTTFYPPFINTGVLDIESGAVTFPNAYTDQGSWIFGISGATNYGKVILNQAPALAGPLQVNLNQGYQVTLADAFALLKFPSHTGAFASLSVTPSEDAALAVTYGPTNAVVGVTGLSRPVITFTAPADLAVKSAPAAFTVSATAPGATNVQFFANGALIGSAPAPFSVSWSSVPAGVYVLTAVARDAQGAVVSAAAPQTVFVVPPRAGGQTYFWNGSASANWSDAANWTPAGVPAAADSAVINQAGPVITANNAINNLVLLNGTLQGSGSFAVGGEMVWSGGGVNRAVTINPTASLIIAGSGNLDFAGGSLANQGTVSWESGNLLGDTSSIIDNSGAWLAHGSNQFITAALFTNSGSYLQNNHAGPVVFYATLNNTGSVETDSGILTLNNGGDLNGPFLTGAGALLTLSSGYFISDTNCDFRGAGVSEVGDQSYAPLYGVLDISTNLHILYGAQISVSPFFQDHGSITNLTFEGSLVGSNYVTGTVTCTAGYIEDWLTVAPSGRLNLAGSNYDITLTGALTVNGVVNWSAGNIYSPSSSFITNNGLWLAQCDETMSANSFVNNGEFRKTNSVRITDLNGSYVNHGALHAASGIIRLAANLDLTGSYIADAGATISFNQGAFTLDAVLPDISGDGVVEQTGGVLTLTADSDPNLALASGQILLGPNFQDHGVITNLTVQGSSLAGNYTVSGTLNWNGGHFAGGLTILPGGVLNIGSSATFQLTVGGITNHGTVNNAGAILLATNTSVVNNNLFIANVNSYIANAFGNSGVFYNNAVVRAVAGAGNSYMETAFVNNGTVDGETGSLYFEDGGALAGVYNAGAAAGIYFASGAFTAASPVITGPGVTQLSGGTLTLGQDIIPNLDLYNGTIILGPSFQAAGAITNFTLGNYCTLQGTNTVTGTFNWLGGNVRGALTIAVGGTLLATNDGTVNLSGASLTNFGAVQLDGYISSFSDATIENDGAWLNQNFSYIYGDGSSAFINNGLFQSLVSSGGCQISEAFTNNGVVDDKAGYLYFDGGGWIGGTYHTATGAFIYFQNGNFYAGASPVLSGSGVISFQSGALMLLQDQIPGLPLNGGAIVFGPNFQDHGAITNLTLAGASLQGTNTVTGNLTVTGGQFAFPLIVARTGVLRLGTGANPSGSVIYFDHTWLANYGQVLWSGITLETYYDTSSITNFGLWLCQGDDTFYNNTDNFYNYGTFRKDGTPGVTRLYYGSFINSGNLDVRTGTLSFNSLSYGQAGANLSFAASAPTLSGHATLDTNINLDGVLTVALTNGYTPVLGDALTLLSYPSHMGTFGEYRLPAISAGLDWQVEVGQTAVTLRVVNSLAADNTLGLSGTVLDDSHHPIPGVVVSAYADATAANLIQNGSFENTPTGVTGPTFYSPLSVPFTNWIVTGPTNDNVAIHGTYLGPPEDGAQYLDLSGLTGNGGAMQSVPTVPGRSYNLVFYHGSYSRNGFSPAFTVSIGSAVYTFGETSGHSGFLDWREVVLPFVASSDSTLIAFSDATTVNSDDNFIDNVQVFAPDSGRSLTAVTDSAGRYQISLADGSYSVGVAGLDAAGFNPVTPQAVTLGGASKVVNFVTQPASSGQNFNITTATTPSNIGRSAGDGSFAAGAEVTVVATITNHALPYIFLGWFENGVLESASATYTFAAQRDRNLVANFGLPVFTIKALNSPVAGGVIAGLSSDGVTTNVGYGQTCILTALPVSPYKFTGWTENNALVNTNLSLTNIVTADHTFLATYAPTNYNHFVTADTSPSGLAPVVGGNRGYFDGQAAVFNVPATITAPPNLYTFQYFTFNGSYFSANNTFTRTIQSSDPATLSVVAVYSSHRIAPIILLAQGSQASPVPATTNFVLTFQFDRSMNTNVAPVLLLSNAAPGAVQAAPPAGGRWISSAVSNDTYVSGPITFGNRMDGNVQVFISAAQDPLGNALALSNPLTLVVKSTPPALPFVAITAPANGAVLVTGQANTVTADARATNGAGNSIVSVTFYNAGVNLGQAAAAPYQISLPDVAGSYALTAVALDASNLMNTSAVVHVTINNPGATLIDFEALNAVAGSVSGAALSNYLAGYGVTLSNVTAGSSLAVQNDRNILNGGLVQASSGDNILTQTGAGGSVSYRLAFSQPYASITWTRPALFASRGGLIAPAWRAHAFNNLGAEVGSVGESQAVTFNNLPAKTFTLLGPNIASVRFDANNTIGSFANLPLDDLLLSTASPGASLAVNLTAQTNGLAAPATVTLAASASIQIGNVTNLDLFEGGNFLRSFPAAAGSLTLSNLASGTYQFTAVATDDNGDIRSSSPATVTIASNPGVSVINFDALDASGGAVGGTSLAAYLSTFGVTVGNVTLGSRLEVLDDASFSGNAIATSPSQPNLLTQDGLSTPVSFTLNLANAAQSVQFTRAALVAGPAGITHPQWSAHILDANGNELESAGEALINSRFDVPSRTFNLVGANIRSIRFDSDSQQTAAFSAVLLDDLILNGAPQSNPLTVSLTAPADGSSAVAPASVHLAATTTDTYGGIDHVEFYAGANLLGSSYAAPYGLVWNDVLAGVYALTAKVIDAGGYATVSAPVQLTVNPGSGSSSLVTFDALDASKAAVSGKALTTYLTKNGMTVTDLTPGTTLTVQNQAKIAGGHALTASSKANVLTQTGSNGLVSFTVQFNPLLTQFNFTRPQLNANPLVSHPAWQAHAFDALGVEVGAVQEPFIASFTNVPAQTFTLSGPGIASVEFDSQSPALATFSAVVLDDFILTSSSLPLPPAIALTNPLPGEIFTAPAVIELAADTAIGAGSVTNVDFYQGATWLGSATQNPFVIFWTNNTVGQYALTAVATSDSGLARTSTVTSITVNPPEDVLGFIAQPVDQSIGLGGQVTFTVNATAPGPITYQWTKNGRPIDAPSAPDLSFPVTANDAGTYAVIISSGGDSLTSSGAVLSLVQPPTITLQPQSQTNHIGDNVTLTVGITGDPPFSCQWLLNGTRIPGATGTNLTLLAVQPFDSGDYQAVVGNSVSFALSDVAHLSVRTANGNSPSADSFADRVSIDPLVGPVFGNNAGATSEPGEPKHDGKAGGASIWYTWHATFTGVISLTTRGSSFDTLLAVYTGADVAHLTLVASDDDSGGFFSSLVTFNVTQGVDYQIAVDGFQKATGDVVLGLPAGTGYRVLNAGSALPVITQQPTNQIVKPGGKITLKVVAASSSPLTYQWYAGSTPIAGANTNTLTITNFQNSSVGVYHALVANGVGSISSAPAAISIGLDSQSASGAAAYGSEDKFGEAVDLAAGGNSAATPPHLTAGGDTRGNTISQVFSTAGATKEPGEPNHCGQPGGASQWYVYTTPSAGTFHADTAGSSFNTILAVYTSTGNSLSNLNAVACGYTTNFTAKGQPSLTIPGVAANTKFYVVVDGYQGASGTAILHLSVGQPPVILAAPVATPAGPNGRATFAVSATGTTNLFYQWQFNGVPLLGATSPSLTVSNAQNQSVGSYSVIVSNVIGVVTSAPALLQILTSPFITAPPLDTSVLVGKSATLSVTAGGAAPLAYQWYKNGVPIAKATKSTLAFAPARFTDSGSFTVVVSNPIGRITNDPPAILTALEAKPPTVTIASPANKATVTTGNVTVTGSASDAYGVAAVQISVNNSAFVPVNGTTRWSVPVTLQPGPNTIAAQAINLSGLVSPVKTSACFYTVKLPLTLLTSGPGTVSGAPAGGQAAIGQAYTLTAVPAKTGSVFQSWSSGVDSNNLTFLTTTPKVSVLMSTNLVLQATFQANPFPDVSGTYNGLVFAEDNITEQSSGFVTFTIGAASKGAFSGKLSLDGGTYPFSGAFDGLGNATVAIARAHSTPVTLILQLDLQPADGEITGSVSNAAWVSALRADLAAGSPDFAGAFTAAVPPGPFTPSGYGYLSLTNTLAGVVKITGALADGAAVSQSVTVSGNGSIPLYASLYAGKGSVFGWLNISNVPPQTLDGAINWFKPAFTNQTAITGSPFSYSLGLFNLPTAQLIISESDWAAPLNYEIAANHNSLTPSGAPGNPTNKLAISVAPTGVITVTFRPTGARADLTAKGAILQQQQNAFGWFTNKTATGFFLLH